MTGFAPRAVPTPSGTAIDRAVHAHRSGSADWQRTPVDAEVTASGPVGVWLGRLRVRPVVEGVVGVQDLAEHIALPVRSGSKRLDVKENDPRLAGRAHQTPAKLMWEGRDYELGKHAVEKDVWHWTQANLSSGGRTRLPSGLPRRQLRDFVNSVSEAGLGERSQ